MSPPDASLAAGQRAFLDTLNHGPAALPDDLFDGPVDRVLLGLKAHANTISHSRLVALEESYPKTRDQLGTALFNALSRAFLERPGVAARPLATIGKGFADHLGPDHPAAADTARIEWAWLTSYHAADATPLALTDLAHIDPQAIVDIVLAAHPAAALVRLTAPLAGPIADESPALAGARAILVTRPHADVGLTPADAAMATGFVHAATAITIGNLIDRIAEQGDGEEALAVIIALIECGALMLA